MKNPFIANNKITFRLKKIIMRKKINIGIILQFAVTGGILLFALSCNMQTSQNSIDHEITVQVPESELYVRVRGNPDKPLIVNLHGGPGGYSGIDIKLMGSGLEDNFLLAYLDQRGCGKSLTCEDTSMLTVEQYLEDLDIVIDSLKNRYNKKKVNLMGTSWGGMYGFLYLLKDQSKINAYACIDGKVNSNYQNHSLIDFETRKAKDLLQTNISEERKIELEHIVSALERIKKSNFQNFHTDVNWMKHEVPPKLGFNAYFADTSKIISFSDVINDSALLQLMKYSKDEYAQIGEKAEIVNAAFRNTPSYNNISIEPELKTIKIPTIVIQGEHDYVVGTEHAERIYNALSGLSEKDKEIHIIPGVGHCPAIESPQKLSELLIDFFNKNE
jgi:pimeloyl-ACP methyl ester carboxylesterase